MHRRTVLILILLIAGTLFQSRATASDTLAQSDRSYDLSWWTVDGGGATFNSGGGYNLGGTAGQPDAAVWSGGGYILAGGFWGGVAVGFRIYLPLVLRGL